jgi:hypothetical protein
MPFGSPLTAVLDQIPGFPVVDIRARPSARRRELSTGREFLPSGNSRLKLIPENHEGDSTSTASSAVPDWLTESYNGFG